MFPNIEPTTFNVLPTVILLFKIVPDVVNITDCVVELGVLNVVVDVVNNIDGIVEFIEVNELQSKAPLTFNDDNHVVAFDNVVTPETFNDDKHVVEFDNVVIPDTFNDELHVIGCDNLPTTTYEVDVDVIPFGVGINPKSPYSGVKNSTVFTAKLLFESNVNEPPYFNDNLLKYSPPVGVLLDNGY